MTTLVATSHRVTRGMVLLYKNEWPGLPTKYELWVVASVRRAVSGSASVRLNRWFPDGSVAEATARFPEGVVDGNWQVFSLSQNDLAHIFSALAAWPEVAPSAELKSGTGR